MCLFISAGHHGIGRRTTARRVLRDLFEEAESPKCLHELNIQNDDPTNIDISLIEQDYQIQPAIQKNKFSSVSDLLLDIFRIINKSSPVVSRLLFLNITELASELVCEDFLSRFLEEFCEELALNPKERAKWTILVACTSEENLNYRKYKDIGKENFVLLKGFDIAETQEMIMLECADIEDEKEAEGFAVQIVEDLKIVAPVTIKLIIKDLDAYIGVKLCLFSNLLFEQFFYHKVKL